jgi:hypothetical protein
VLAAISDVRAGIDASVAARNAVPPVMDFLSQYALFIIDLDQSWSVCFSRLCAGGYCGP